MGTKKHGQPASKRASFRKWFQQAVSPFSNSTTPPPSGLEEMPRDPRMAHVDGQAGKPTVIVDPKDQLKLARQGRDAAQRFKYMENVGSPESFRYRILEVLGKGGMATVYKAYDPSLGRHVALKFVRDLDPHLKIRLAYEARAQAQIEHPNICKIYEVGEKDFMPFIAMQYVDGKTLEERAPELGLEQKVRLVKQVAEALHAAHRAGLIHRDVKPSNIMVERNEEGQWTPFIMDFGVARFKQGSGLTIEGSVIGTLLYVSPEQAEGKVHKIDRRSDVYSLGVTLFQLLTGKVPFSGNQSPQVLFKIIREAPPAPRSLDPAIPPDLEAIVLKCLQKKPGHRYHSAKALALDLQRFLDGDPIEAHAGGLAYRTTKWVRKNRTLSAVMALVLLVALSLSSILLAYEFRARRLAQWASVYGEKAREVEEIMRLVYRMPLHDLSAEKERVYQKISIIENSLARADRLAVGPAHFALGRAHLALQDYDRAYQHLAHAERAGYQDPPFDRLMGTVLSLRYQWVRSFSAGLGAQPNQTLERETLLQARKYLARSLSAESENDELYFEALLAYLNGEYEDGLAFAERAAEVTPWNYEAYKLQGDIRQRLAREKEDQGNLTSAARYLDAAERAYARAQVVARGDPALLSAVCRCHWRRLQLEWRQGYWPPEIFTEVARACDQALIADSELGEVHLFLATAHRLRAQIMAAQGQNDRPDLEQALHHFRLASQIKTGFDGFRPLFENQIQGIRAELSP